MEEYDGNQKGVEEENEDLADGDEDANVRDCEVGKFAVCVICQREVV